MLAVIPARGGSKGIPGKNIKELNGKPLIKYTIDAARKIFREEDILVSTDDIKIKQVVENFGIHVPFLRPQELAGDHVSMQEVLLHAIEFEKQKGRVHKTIVLLQPTSPFRRADQIKEAMELYTAEIDMIASVKETRSNPYYVLKEENSDGFLETSKTGSFVRRQDCPKVWELNGAIYVINVESLKNIPMVEFKKVKKYVMDDFTSHDIDEQFDWLMAEQMVRTEFSSDSKKNS